MDNHQEFQLPAAASTPGLARSDWRDGFQARLAMHFECLKNVANERAGTVAKENRRQFDLLKNGPRRSTDG